MIWVLATITVGLALGVLIEECRGRGLFASLVQEVPAGHPEFAYLDDDLVELPIHDGWEPEDVARTYAEIQGL